MEETLDEALGRVRPARRARWHTKPRCQSRPRAHERRRRSRRPRRTSPTPTTQAREIYDRAMKAQREGNWALYGEEIKRLGEVLAELSKC